MTASGNAAIEPIVHVRYPEKPMKPQFHYSCIHAMATKILVT